MSISKVLGINKEVVRGWVKKGRGNPIAKTFVNKSIVEQELFNYIRNDNSLDENKIDDAKSVNRSPTVQEISETNIQESSNKIEKESDFYSELEKELIYHLKTIPTGVTSLKVLKSILIHHRSASLKDIKKVMLQSKHIIQNQRNGKWMLKQFVSSFTEEPDLDEDLKRINCKKGQDDEIIC